MNYDERTASRVRRINTTVYLPATLVEVLDRISESEDKGFTAIAERVIRKGLAVERAERESKQADAK